MASSTGAAPAEAYAAARSRAAHPRLTEFAALLPFELDPFQHRACAALEEGHGVLVCAPTGAGKTVVGEFAVHLALAQGLKCFYTTPIKALSNQKYADLVERHGVAAVGLLTGDTAVNGDAQVVVMTTEVLRNMIYAGSRQLTDLGFVVMDEVHYLADRFRGAVWEEVILQLPEHVALVSLSATVSNAEEFGDWLVTVRGDTAVVVDEHRPVPLWQHMMVGPRLLDLFGGENAGGELVVDPVLVRRPLTWSGRARSGTAEGDAGPGGATPASGPRRGSRSSTGSTARACCPPSRSSSAARAATPPSDSACAPGCASPPRPRSRRSAPRSTGAPPSCRRATSPCWATGSGARRWSGASRRTTRACCPRSRRRWRSCSCAGWSARCSPPRRSRWASTCLPAPSCWSGWSSSTARATPS